MGKKEAAGEDKDETPPRILMGEDAPVYEGYRLHLPAQMRDRNPFNVLQILKDCIGKDVTRIAMPISINEPLTLLQRFAENLEYIELLEKASNCTDSLDRLKHISAFVVSGLSGILERISKPFNPILGETFEMTHPNGRTRFVAEQVSHHPPICVFHLEDIEGRFKLTGSCQAKIKFLGRAVNIHVKNVVSLEFPEYDETYSWGAVDCVVDNLFIGKPRIEYDGTFTITNNKTKEYAKFDVHNTSMFTNKKPNEVEGHIYDTENNKKFYLFGFCNSHLCVANYTESIHKQRGKLNRQITPNTPGSKKGKNEGEAVFEEPEMETAKFEQPEKESDHDEENMKKSREKTPSSDGDKSDDVIDFDTLWAVNARPIWCQDEYCLTSFATILNEITDDISKRFEEGTIPKTDSRFRPDLRKLENGDLEKGAEEKLRLESKQRQAEKARSKSKDNWTPLWFVWNEQNKKWEFNHTYWDRKYENSPDIF
ncbi:oxysterol-binding protein-related protein 1-like isoform X3 [Symsagittifera roscoffensis]|uniref:oxysterol-binding protein-related protein 1-like isoform X3 n=1 Tax=Symsagittifera roscoffensis TaxID=84072 RepID=UPI00307B242C